MSSGRLEIEERRYACEFYFLAAGEVDGFPRTCVYRRLEVLPFVPTVGQWYRRHVQHSPDPISYGAVEEVEVVWHTDESISAHVKLARRRPQDGETLAQFASRLRSDGWSPAVYEEPGREWWSAP